MIKQIENELKNNCNFINNKYICKKDKSIEFVIQSNKCYCYINDKFFYEIDNVDELKTFFENI